MKKLLLVFVMGLGLTAVAQKSTMPSSKAQMEQMTPEQMTQKQLAHLTKELKLEPSQQQKVEALLSERNMKVKDLKMQKDALDAKGAQATPEEKKMLKQKMMAQKSDFEGKMKAVLTADQFKKWMAMREEGKEKMMEKKGMK